MKYLQKLGKALMLPVSCMPICGLLMGLGYLLCPAAMQGGEITGITACIGYFLIRAGGALIDHIAWLFAVGVGIGMSENNEGTGALAALVSWLTITTLLNVDTVKTLIPAVTENSSRFLAFTKIDNPFIGILAGIIGSTCYNRFHKTRLPDWLSFFSGKRAVAIIAGVFSIVVSFILLLIWPLVFSGLTALGQGIAHLGAAGAGIYAFLNRLLIPFGLHHALNNVFWFDTIGLGDLTHFWAGETSADVSWSLGMYMSGFFPCMMFGVPAAALAIIRSAKPDRQKAAMGILLSSAVCAFVCGVTEPFEFSFMFLSPVLYLAYAALYGIISFLTVISGFRAGFSFSAGFTDLIFSASLPAAAKTWLILPLGALAFVLFYTVFHFMIRRWNLKTPGREDDENALAAEASGSGSQISVPAQSTYSQIHQNDTGNTSSERTYTSTSGKKASSGRKRASSGRKKASSDGKYTSMAQAILLGLGGGGNLLSVDNCITRLRLEIKDMDKVDDGAIRSAGALGLIRPGKNSLQIVIGTTVQFVADELKALLEKSPAGDPAPVNTVSTSPSGTAPEKAYTIPVPGRHRMITRQDLIFRSSDGLPEGDHFDFVITDKTGIHARPAAGIVEIAKRYNCEITIEANGKISSAKSITGLMALGATEGTRLSCRVSGQDSEQALRVLYQYMKENL